MADENQARLALSVGISNQADKNTICIGIPTDAMLLCHVTLCAVTATLLAGQSCEIVYRCVLVQDILTLEEQEGAVNFKFGVLYAKAGQKTDDEMFSNGENTLYMVTIVCNSLTWFLLLLLYGTLLF